MLSFYMQILLRALTLLQATIVTADGSILKASPTSHEDLFCESIRLRLDRFIN